MDELINAFNQAHQGEIEIDEVVVPGTYYQKLKTAIATGQAPDLAIVHSR